MAPRVVVVGAGIAGVSLASALTLRSPAASVTLLDPGDPLGLTTSSATGAYRNYWLDSDGAMNALLAASLDRLEARARTSAHSFQLSRPGYAHFSCSAEGSARLEREALELSSRGAGPLRSHPGFHPYDPVGACGWEAEPGGVDVLEGHSLVRMHFPYVTPDAALAVHYRRCGFLDPVMLGRELLAEARSRGAVLVGARACALRIESGRIRGVELEDGSVLPADQVALACGPGLQQLAATAGVSLPLVHEPHWKLMLPDPGGVVPENAPLMILADPVRLEGETLERPGGAHLRPARRKGRREVHILWGYCSVSVPPEFPLRPDPEFARLALAGASRLVPGLGQLDASLGEVTGGYYCKAPDPRPLLGPIGLEGLFVLGGLSGFGVMVSQAAADLVAGSMMGDAAGVGLRPFLPGRFDDPGYMERWQSQSGAAGQL